MVVQHFLNHPWRLTISVLKLGCAYHLFTTHLCQVAPCQGPSMLPTFSVDGDYIAVDMRHARDRRRQLRVGDLVLYSIPISDETGLGVKRLIGLPGDYVSMGTPDAPGEDKTIQVPEGHCWIAGDNLTASRDSRHFGPLPVALIKGKVVAQILPWSQRGWIKSVLQPSHEPGV